MSFEESESLIETAAGFVGQAISDLQEIDPVRDGSAVAPAGRCRLITGRTRANMPVSHQRRWGR